MELAVLENGFHFNFTAAGAKEALGGACRTGVL